MTACEICGKETDDVKKVASFGHDYALCPTCCERVRENMSWQLKTGTNAWTHQAVENVRKHMENHIY
jgi:ribosome-binding protein aMBF1 (putative translation factor)